MNDRQQAPAALSRADRIFNQLTEDIMCGKFNPGDRLVIDIIAKDYNVSHTPVREALARIAGTGLAERAGLKGFRVAPLLTDKEVAEIVEVRMLLEISALKNAFHSRATMVKDLKNALRRQRSAADKIIAHYDHQDFSLLKEYFDADWEFHEIIMTYAGNNCLQQIVNNLSFSRHRMRQVIAVGKSDAEFAISEHTLVIKAIESDDLDFAVQAMSKHLQGLLSRANMDSRL